MTLTVTPTTPLMDPMTLTVTPTTPLMDPMTLTVTPTTPLMDPMTLTVTPTTPLMDPMTLTVTPTTPLMDPVALMDPEAPTTVQMAPMTTMVPVAQPTLPETHPPQRLRILNHPIGYLACGAALTQMACHKQHSPSHGILASVTQELQFALIQQFRMSACTWQKAAIVFFNTPSGTPPKTVKKSLSMKSG